MASPQVTFAKGCMKSQDKEEAPSPEAEVLLNGRKTNVSIT